ncbi:MAG TPA: putative Ig domain-containing protein [Bryobacteraceae bacterium]|jgi:hypothetical protein|nr:putative Ig domain-containing protein [Bryobacteraceae bacterium]
MQLRWTALSLLLFASPITIHTSDSCVLAKDTYASILFAAKGAPNTGVPTQFSFHTSGKTPPGMIFEGYPCHQPGKQNCQALASADGIYLDGTPATAGSYRVSITAQDPAGNTRTQAFTITVKP